MWESSDVRACDTEDCAPREDDTLTVGSKVLRDYDSELHNSEQNKL